MASLVLDDRLAKGATRKRSRGADALIEADSADSYAP